MGPSQDELTLLKQQRDKQLLIQRAKIPLRESQPNGETTLIDRVNFY